MMINYRLLLKRWAIPISLLALALLVRVPGLSGFTTFDESRWINRSRWFAAGLLFDDIECPPVAWGREFATRGLGCTLQIGYPGATTMWAGSLGLLGYYEQTIEPTTGIDLPTFLKTLSIYRLDSGVIRPTRLPLAIISALFIPLFYLLVSRLFDTQIAIVASLLVALQPFHVALSRIVHHDALNSTFMVLSLLALIGYWLRNWPGYWLPISAILAGFALLSKQVSWFLPPFVIVLAGLTWLHRWCNENDLPQEHRFRRAMHLALPLIAQGVMWGLVAGLTFVLFFPAMWVMPLETLKVIFSTSTGLAQEGHTHYFLGEISKNPGALFYPVGWALRATPLEIVGIVGAAVGLSWHLGRANLLKVRAVKDLIINHPTKLALTLYVGLLLAFVLSSNKKLVRYFLPAFPIIDILAALGLSWILASLTILFRRNSGALSSGIAARGSTILLSMIILGMQGWLLWSHYPYYLTYHNPLFGGTPGAARLMTIIGWGEGLNEAADYLNRQPEAKSTRVVTERFCSMLIPFYVGRVSCLNSSLGGILRADYVVYYYNVVQRELQQMEQWRYFSRHGEPIHRVNLGGLDYVTIYRNPIQHQVDRQANSLPRIFSTFGYNLAAEGQLRLFWQNLGLEDRQLMVGLAPTRGVYPVGGAAIRSERHWALCAPDPQFRAELEQAKAIIESNCSLSELELKPGLYDLQLAVGDDRRITPVESSLLAIVLVDQNGRFKPVELLEVAENN